MFRFRDWGPVFIEDIPLRLVVPSPSDRLLFEAEQVFGAVVGSRYPAGRLDDDETDRADFEHPFDECLLLLAPLSLRDILSQPQHSIRVVAADRRDASLEVPFAI